MIGPAAVSRRRVVVEKRVNQRSPFRWTIPTIVLTTRSGFDCLECVLDSKKAVAAGSECGSAEVSAVLKVKPVAVECVAVGLGQKAAVTSKILMVDFEAGLP